MEQFGNIDGSVFGGQKVGNWKEIPFAELAAEMTKCRLLDTISTWMNVSLRECYVKIKNVEWFVLYLEDKRLSMNKNSVCRTGWRDDSATLTTYNADLNGSLRARYVKIKNTWFSPIFSKQNRSESILVPNWQNHVSLMIRK